MYPFDAVVTPAQGGSLRFFFSKKKRKINYRYKKLLDEEIKSKLNSYDKSMSYKKNV